MDCSTIIVSYNTFELTRQAVNSALEAAAGLEHEVIIVDNDSPDESAERLQSIFPKTGDAAVRVIANDQNRGFATANNQGAEKARGDILFFLNPDTIVHGQAIRTLYEFTHEHSDAGAVGPRVINPDGTVQKSISSKVTPWSLITHHLPIESFFRGQRQHQIEAPRQITRVDIVKGCALCIRRDVFNQIGGWDESYFMYTEERELCYAAQEAGFTNYYCPDACITHFGGASTLENYADQQVVHHRSVLQFLERHHPLSTRLIHRITGTIGFGIRAFLFPLMASFRSGPEHDYLRRGRAARKLFRWFLCDYSSEAKEQ